MTPEEIEKDLSEKSDWVVNNHAQKFFSWYRQILIMASGLLSVLVALHKERATSEQEHNFYVFTIGGLVIGIVSGSILLFAEVNNAYRIRNEFHRLLEERNRIGNQGGIKVYVTVHRFFLIFEIVSYLAFVSALVSLSLYAVNIDAPFQQASPTY